MNPLSKLITFSESKDKRPKYENFKDQVDREWAKHKDELMPAIMRELDKELECALGETYEDGIKKHIFGIEGVMPDEQS